MAGIKTRTHSCGSFISNGAGLCKGCGLRYDAAKRPTSARLNGPHGYVEVAPAAIGYRVRHSEDDLGLLTAEALRDFAKELLTLLDKRPL